MVKHIVFWRLKETASGATKAENARIIKEKLEALQGRIPGLIRIEVGIDFQHSPDSSDVVLYSEFVDRAALETYAAHPEHKAVMPIIGAAREERRVVDYEA